MNTEPCTNQASFDFVTGRALQALCADYAALPQRVVFSEILRYAEISSTDAHNTMHPLIVLYGLCYTGKSTMLKQIAFFVWERAAFVKITQKGADFCALVQRMTTARAQGIRYFFIDEITKLVDFPVFVEQLVHLRESCLFFVSGTDSLAFWLAKNEELYKNSVFFHTTFIPYYEFKHLFPDVTVDTYIQRSGVFQNLTLNTAILPDKLRGNIVDQYIYTAIARNIQNALSRRFDGNELGLLAKLYDEDVLTHAIMRVVQNDAHRFFAKNLSSKYASTDIKKALGECLHIENIPLGSELEEKILKKLGMLNNGLVSRLTNIEAEEIKNYLFKIDVFKEIDEYFIVATECVRSKETILIQPGLRYAQIIAVLDTIFDDEDNEIRKKIYSNCVGTLFEECVRYNTWHCLANDTRDIFKLRYSYREINAEFDMIVYDKKEKFVDIYEIKHGLKPKDSWFSNFCNNDFAEKIEEMFAPIRNRHILYTGATRRQAAERVQLVNVDEFLQRIAPTIPSKITACPVSCLGS